MWFFQKTAPAAVPEPEEPREALPRFETEFDLEGQSVFSIERLNGRTIIGYCPRREVASGDDYQTIRFGKPKEWHLWIDVHEHNALVARFRKKLGREKEKEAL